MATLDSTASVAEIPIEQELKDKGINTMSAIATSSNSSSGNSQASPRNTSVTMSTGTFVQLGLVEVSKSLQDGEKFVKWDEVSPFFIFFFINSEGGLLATRQKCPQKFFL